MARYYRNRLFPLHSFVMGSELYLLLGSSVVFKYVRDINDGTSLSVHVEHVNINSDIINIGDPLVYLIKEWIA